jgi:uncharacterized protein YbjT (DUF2867 family)/uncharacterized membrane protein YphA (DoxX/SURF4 family)
MRHPRPEDGPSVQADFAKVPPRHWWLPRLAEIDAVVNTVGILREQGAQTFQALHTDAPIELFEACALARVPLVLQISALGADDQARSRYHLSKKAADDRLRRLPVRSVIVQPSVVYGPGGTSARLFNRMAAAPLLPLPHRGAMQVQPVHLDDVVQGLVAAIETPPREAQTLVFSGPQPLALGDYLGRLRGQLGFGGRLRLLPMPESLFRLSAAIAGKLPGSMLDAETAGMLLRGNAATDQAFARLLGRPPRPVEAFVSPTQAEPMRREAALALWLPVLRIAVALVWIWTGIVSLGLYPTQDSYELLARVGVGPALAPLMLYGAAVLDLLVGLATLVMSRLGWLWLLQLAVILGYTIIITFKLPEFWLHPYGPLSKNLVMLAAIYLLYTLEPRRWNTSS